ncbi:SDR family NAD(P)-dependent oxidoreductase [Saccharomonospora saliphila]|uniref:SDR family NAD(P)-dependent oxidoreductase n=1 Tax=Saccharomonospora saliphila TaxID=369829 RepID=UPI0003747BAA|nr:SDR family NAD(P)-dependent oxidoreductase [Saccharomonospora saliphila]
MGSALAVVTGASAGIGRELVREFSRHSYDLVVCADDERVGEAAEEARAHGVEAWAVRADLATASGVSELAERVGGIGRAVDVLALNAGVGVGGPFAGADTRLDDQLRVVECNVTGTVHLAKRLLPDMVARGTGRVLVSSSTVARLPGPYQATYNASKAFLHSFAVAIGSELRGTGVTVTVLLPGLTDTEFFDRAHMTDTKIGAARIKDDPARVAREAYAALTAGRTQVVTGPAYNRVLMAAGRLLPDRLLARVHSVFSAPGSARSAHARGSARPAHTPGPESARSGR